MRGSRFSKAQIVSLLKDDDAGVTSVRIAPPHRDALLPSNASGGRPPPRCSHAMCDGAQFASDSGKKETERAKNVPESRRPSPVLPGLSRASVCLS
jgi:hypothetical protein